MCSSNYNNEIMDRLIRDISEPIILFTYTNSKFRRNTLHNYIKVGCGVNFFDSVFPLSCTENFTNVMERSIRREAYRSF